MSLRTRASVVAVMLATALASSVPTRAIQQPQGPATGSEGAAGMDTPLKDTGPSVSKPFQQLFDVQRATPSDPFRLQDRMRERRFPQQSGVGPEPPRTVCGLTVWNIDPVLDSRMRLQPPQPPNVTYTIKKITTPVCQE